MNPILLAVLIVLFDFVAFAVPLGSVFIAYVLITKPQWVLDYVQDLYKD